MSPALLPADGVVRQLLREVADFAFASVCAGCGAAGTALCGSCAVGLARSVVRPRSEVVALRAGLVFDSAAAAVLRGQGGRPDLADPVAAAGARCGRGRLVQRSFSAASHRRRRARADGAGGVSAAGFRLPELLARGTGIPILRALSYTRRVRDQRGLGVQERRSNLAGGLVATRAGGGRAALIVDDVITTGATCEEAARALRSAGFLVVGAVAVAATRRRG
jgi:hypothetical protein